MGQTMQILCRFFITLIQYVQGQLRQKLPNFVTIEGRAQQNSPGDKQLLPTCPS